MNWLAHVFLSPDDIQFQLGNLLADVVRGEELRAQTATFQRGARQHKLIDAFTDAHPCVQTSRERLHDTHRRFSGVLVDVFYDHLLASNWNRYSAQPLPEFTQAFYRAATPLIPTLTGDARLMVERIIHHDLLTAYAHTQGLHESLQRLSARLAARWQRTFRLEDSLTELQRQRAGFEADFVTFFPELQAYIQTLPGDALTLPLAPT